MILVVGVTAIAAIGTFAWMWRHWDEPGYGLFCGVMAGSFASLITLLVGGLIAAIYTDPKWQDPPTVQTIVAASDSDRVSGGLFVIATDDHYSFYVDNGDGSYSRSSIEATSSVRIIESNDEEPRIEIVKDLSDEFAWTLYPQPIVNEDPRVTIYVPEGSIKQEFNLDLED